tara:strand:- start:7150 stop:7317 length:168 start_codon:yes stop_codon:yes gene_type:complete
MTKGITINKIQSAGSHIKDVAPMIIRLKIEVVINMWRIDMALIFTGFSYLMSICI